MPSTTAAKNNSREMRSICYFFLDTYFPDFYTFDNCNTSAAGFDVHIEKGRIEKMATKKAAKKAPAKKAAKKAAKKK
jgi:hypothetical protein